MKNIYKASVFLFSILLMSSSSFAQVKDFNQCVLHHLVNQFQPSFGNRDFYSLPATGFIETSSNQTSAVHNVIFVPGWKSYSDQTGVTTAGYQYEVTKEMSAAGTIQKNDAGINIFYSSRGSMVADVDRKYDVAAGLTVSSGIPYLTADKKVEKKCTVNAYGQENCEPEIIYSNFKVVVPKTYQPVATWKNSKTGLDSQFKLDVESYLSCLRGIH